MNGTVALFGLAVIGLRVALGAPPDWVTVVLGFGVGVNGLFWLLDHVDQGAPGDE